MRTTTFLVLVPDWKQMLAAAPAADDVSVAAAGVVAAAGIVAFEVLVLSATAVAARAPSLLQPQQITPRVPLVSAYNYVRPWCRPL